jgi:heat shock protein HslJ
MYSCSIGIVWNMSSPSASKVGKAQPSLVNTKWTLADNVKGKIPTLNIEGEKITGNAGCNNYFGTATIDPSTGEFLCRADGIYQNDV